MFIIRDSISSVLAAFGVSDVLLSNVNISVGNVDPEVVTCDELPPAVLANALVANAAHA